MVSLSDFVKKSLRISNHTDSSAHTNTKNVKASFVEVATVPVVAVPEDFWCKLIRYKPDSCWYSSESHVTLFNVELLNAIIEGLGIDCTVVPQVANMDVEPDLSLFFSKNRLPALNWEDKKGIGNSMWSNDSACAGQVFEQLILTKGNVGGEAYGIQSTYNGVRLVSTHDWSNHPPLSPPSPPASSPQSGVTVTPDRNTSTFFLQGSLSSPPKRASVKSSKDKAVRKIPKIPAPLNQPVGDLLKRTRITDLGLPREFFASKVYELGDDTSENMEAKNKEVVNLLCAALLLAQESANTPKADLCGVPYKGVCRVFNLGTKKKIFPSSVEIKDGIRFEQCPTLQNKLFYSLTQVGSGATAVCCLAVTSDASICALKIFKKTISQKEAEAELEHWKTIYSRRSKKQWSFMRVEAVAGTVILVLPFLNVPGNKQERMPFLEGDKDQDTLLWKALDSFAATGHTHDDLKWHHVGAVSATSSTTKKRRRCENPKQQMEAFLLDLGKVTRNGKMKDPVERRIWVKDNFAVLKRRHEKDEDI